MFLEFINLVTKHLFTCLKSDPILLKSQKLQIYLMASDSDSNYKTHRIKNLMMLTYQFKQIIVLDKCFGRNKKYR